jgi:hypothetical protein
MYNINKNAKDYLYMSDLNQTQSMALNLSSLIIAESKDGKQLTNFTNGCVAEDIVVSMDYNITTESNVSKELNLKTKKGSKVYIQRVVDLDKNKGEVKELTSFSNIDIAKENFLDKNEGNTTVNILSTIKKNLNEVINPVKINFISFDVNSTNCKAKAKGGDRVPTTKEKSGNIDKERIFYFARVASDKKVYYSSSDKEIITPINVEIYCAIKNNSEWCTDTMNLNTIGLNSYRTAKGWYIAKEHDSNKDGKVKKLNSNKATIITKPKTIPNFSDGRIDSTKTIYTQSSLPKYNERATITIDTDFWLRYKIKGKNAIPSYNELHGIPSFDVNYKKESSMTGIGKAGHIIQSPKEIKNSGKLNW